MSLCLRKLAALGALFLSLLAVSHASDPSPSPAWARAQEANERMGLQLDSIWYWAQVGYERPQIALQGLQSIEDAGGLGPMLDTLWLVRGVVLAESGRTDEAENWIQKFRSKTSDTRPSAQQARADLIRATLAHGAGRSAEAAQWAQSALDHFKSKCPKDLLEGSPWLQNRTLPPSQRIDCDFRAMWRAHHILERRARATGLAAVASHHNQRSLYWATAAADSFYRIRSLGELAYLHGMEGQWKQAERSLGQARRMLSPRTSELQPWLLNIESLIAGMQKERDRADRLLALAIQEADAMGLSRFAARFRSNLSDIRVQQGRASEAAKLAAEAIPGAQKFNDRPVERTARINLALAETALGGAQRIAKARASIEAIIQELESEASDAYVAIVMVEFGEALARAGDLKGALEFYDRERARSSDKVRRALQRSSQEMHRQINAGQTERTQALEQKRAMLDLAQSRATQTQWLIWALRLLLLALGLTLLIFTVSRVRAALRLWKAHQRSALLQEDSDPMTGLASRKQLHDTLKQWGMGNGIPFAGSLWLLDLDHFKSINDQYGHLTGDAIIVEIGKRLQSVVRDGDMVVRWGGDEIIIAARHQTAELARSLSGRIHSAITQRPFVIESGIGAGSAVSVPVTIAWASYPLVDGGATVDHARALRLMEHLMRIAKSLGTNREVGLLRIKAVSDSDLQAVEDDFDRAWGDGRVELITTSSRNRHDH